MDSDPADAFALLGAPTRMATLSAFADAARDGDRPVTLTFTELFEATDEATSAGFAYHLRQLRGHYLDKVARDGEDGYRLTDAGRRVVRALAAGAYTERVDRDPVAVPEPCPFCEGELQAATADNVVTVGCTACGRDVCKLPFPPGGFASHDEPAELLAAVDRLHRNRVRLMREGTCPDCGGATATTVSVAEREDGTPGPAHASLSCTVCGERINCPVTVALLSHPALVAFGQAHGTATVTRPVWNVGEAFSETVLSTDPVCIRVGWRLDEEELTVLVGADCSVGHVERTPLDGADDQSDEAAGSVPA